MRKLLYTAFFCLQIAAFPQQISINRIDQMPFHPTPYLMRDWKQVTRGYDSLVFNPNTSGQYLPLIFFSAHGTNYPSQPFFGLSTVVGTTRPKSTEAINVLPAIVGATLTGINKSSQYGYNYVLMAQDYFNKRAAENVYLNGPLTESGTDWWYETMPNIYFYQMNYLYPHTGDFDYQVTTVADRIIQEVQALGGSTTPWKTPSMNYRAFSLSTMTPLKTGVIEPEAAGAIAWILYSAYHTTKNESYRIGAEQAMEFLNSLTSNPSYEIQLPYGVYAAARMNAELGTNYDVQKMLSWTFDVGPLRTWGAMTGTWGGYDVSGVIGENSSNPYAFIMNGFQQAGALMPLVRYDARFASALGKWALNLANASRLFYPNYLPSQNQDAQTWSSQYDPNSYIAHEAMRQTLNSVSPFATGDAVGGGWGQTNLSLYSSSSVGYLGSQLDTTDVPQILRFDLLKTDFYHDTAYATYLYYNPYDVTKSVTLALPAGNYDLYDAVSKTFLSKSVSGVTSIALPAQSACVVVLAPANGAVTYSGTKMLINNVVVDYYSGQSQGFALPRIKSLSPGASVLPLSVVTKLYCTAVSPVNDTLEYTWQVSAGTITGGGSVITYNAPADTATVIVSCTVTDKHGGSVKGSTVLSIVQRTNHAPVITQLKASPQKVTLNSNLQLTCSATDADGDPLRYTWMNSAGTLPDTGTAITWTAPSTTGNFYLTCKVTDDFGGSAQDSVLILVRDFAQYQTGGLVAYYPFSGNAKDASGNGHDGFAYLTTLTSDRHNQQSSAYLFDGATSYIQVRNTTDLNFTGGITLNFWMTLKNLFTTREQYPVSHGNWQYRWKVSLSNNKLRWTVKTNTGVHDLDAKSTFSLDSLYNITAMYDGSAMEIYVNGVLDAAVPWSGAMMTTDYDLIFGESLPGNSQYNFSGILDDVRLYNYALLPDKVQAFYDMASAVNDGKQSLMPADFKVTAFPNPCNGQISLRVSIPNECKAMIKMIDVLGREAMSVYTGPLQAGTRVFQVDLAKLSSGPYFVLLQADNRTKIEKVMILK